MIKNRKGRNLKFETPSDKTIIIRATANQKSFLKGLQQFLMQKNKTLACDGYSQASIIFRALHEYAKQEGY